MATNASGRQYNAIVGRQEGGSRTIGGTGAVADNNWVPNNRLFMRLAQINGFNYDGGFQNATILKSGRRSYEDGDFIQQYGSGTWTWDFDYIVENKKLLQGLVSLVTEVDDTTAAATLNPTQVNANRDYSHGLDSDFTAQIVLEAGTVGTGLDSDDQCLHSAVLQNLTLALDAGTDGGRLHTSGQFMSGYSPIISNSGITGATTASDYEKSIFDFTTVTVGGHTVTCKAFSMTISNPATRVGYQQTTGQADGYVRGGLFDVSGTVSVKYDANMADALTDWTNGTPYALAFTLSNFSFVVANARMTGHNIDFADEGMFVEIPWTATTGVGATEALAVIKVF